MGKIDYRHRANDATTKIRYEKLYYIFLCMFIKTINNPSNPLRIDISNYSVGLYLVKEKSEKTIRNSTFLKLKVYKAHLVRKYREVFIARLL